MKLIKRQAYDLKFPFDILIKNCQNYITQKKLFKPEDTKYTKFANKSSVEADDQNS